MSKRVAVLPGDFIGPEIVGAALTVLRTLEEAHGVQLEFEMLPFGAEAVAQCEPVYEEMPGWSESTVGVRDWSALPANARRYLERLCELARAPIDLVSTGPDRDETIVLRHPFS